MTPEEVSKVIERIQEWWETVTIRPGVAKGVWVPALATVPLDIALEAIMRYARKQRNNYPPSVDDLLPFCDEIDHERQHAALQAKRDEQDRLAAAAWRKAHLSQDAALPLAQAIEAAAHAQTAASPLKSDRALYAQHMAELTMRHIGPWADTDGKMHPKLTFTDCAAQCFAWAGEYEHDRSTLADDFLSACRQFEAFACEED